MAIETISDSKHYTLGKGSLLFQEGESFDGKYEELGNAPSFNMTVEIEKVEHYSSKSGAKIKDKEIIVQKAAKGNVNLDEPRVAIIKKFFLGDVTETTQALGTDVAVTIASAALDKWQEMGKQTVSNVVVKDSAEVTIYVKDTDYNIDIDEGLIRTLSTGNILEGDELKITLDHAEVVTQSIKGLSKNKIDGHLYYKSDNPTGRKQIIKAYVTLTPSGDLSMIGDDWQTITFDIEAIEHEQYSGIIEYKA